jgi:NAD(P)-dependent dehydrogenase (short-subunit alcohol dehydrogenase family)
MGRAIVRAYAAEGARVTLTYVSDEEAASSIVKEVESGGGSAAAVPMDLTDHPSIERAVSEAASRHGGLDVLVANACGGPPMPRARWSKRSRSYGRRPYGRTLRARRPPSGQRGLCWPNRAMAESCSSPPG